MSKMTFASGAMIAAIAFTSQVMAARDDVAAPLHRGPWPIQNGHNHQPTEHELNALHLKDVTADQAREIDRLYNELLANSEHARKRQPGSER